MSFLCSILVLLASTSALAFGPSPKPDLNAKVPPLKHVVVVLLENEKQQTALEQSFMKKLVAQGATLADHHGVARPSQPNYIAMTAGATHGATHDDNVDLDVSHIGDLLEEKGLMWKAYAEGFPGDCFQGEKKGAYRRKHLPFISYKNIQNNPARCARIVPDSQFDRDWAAQSLPAFSFYVPDMNNDGHDTTPAYSDAWLEKRFGPYLKNPAFTRDVLFIVTYDESSKWDFSNHIYTVLVGGMVKPGSKVEYKTTHYSLLKLFEEGFGLRDLGLGDSSANSITGIWTW